MVSSVDDARALPSYTVQQNRSIETGAARAKDQITAVLTCFDLKFLRISFWGAREKRRRYNFSWVKQSSLPKF